jgi:hypothetical protein
VTRDSELAALAGRFPGWEAWKGVSGLWYARRREVPAHAPGEYQTVIVSGEDVEDLADAIDRAERLSEG